MSHATTSSPAEIRDRVRALVSRHGMVRAARLLGLSRESLARVVGALPVRHGTEAQIRERLSAAEVQR